MKKIMVTGSEGLVGAHLTLALERHGYAVERMDLRAVHESPPGDICDAEACRARADGCIGIIHLAAVSRVVWGERDPRRCWQTNVNGTANILGAARSARSRAWVLFASSREVYGQPARMPVQEDDPLQPVNIYGRSKAEGNVEMLVSFGVLHLEGLDHRYEARKINHTVSTTSTPCNYGGTARGSFVPTAAVGRASCTCRSAGIISCVGAATNSATTANGRSPGGVPSAALANCGRGWAAIPMTTSSRRARRECSGGPTNA